MPAEVDLLALKVRHTRVRCGRQDTARLAAIISLLVHRSSVAAKDVDALPREDVDCVERDGGARWIPFQFRPEPLSLLSLASTSSAPPAPVLTPLSSPLLPPNARAGLSPSGALSQPAPFFSSSDVLLLPALVAGAVVGRNVAGRFFVVA